MRAVASSDEPVGAGELLEESQLTAGSYRVQYPVSDGCDSDGGSEELPRGRVSSRAIWYTVVTRVVSGRCSVSRAAVASCSVPVLSTANDAV